MKAIPDRLKSVLVSLSEEATKLLDAEGGSIFLREGDQIYLDTTVIYIF
ncbi:hypothetical protein ACFL6S_34430 [Candidatus Poribacteria bacterium]